jgi:hypothetical protein
MDSDLGQVYKFEGGNVIAVLERLKTGCVNLICTMRQMAAGKITLSNIFAYLTTFNLHIVASKTGIYHLQ